MKEQTISANISQTRILVVDDRPVTAEILACVISQLRPEERERLNGHIQAVYQKDSLPMRKFADQAINTIEESNETQKKTKRK